MTESQIQAAIIEWLQWHGAIALRINSGMQLIQNRDGSTRAFRGAPQGTADILACWKGRFLAVEVKKPGGKIRPGQPEFIQAVKDAGGIAFFAWSVDDLERELEGDKP